MKNHNLPHQSTSFIGRETELAEIDALLSDPTCRLLTLVGSGGIGKTRLALRAAADLLPQFAHGVYFVPLTPVDSADMIASAIASAIQLSFFGAEDLHTQVFDYLRDKHLLLLLDNFEHLLDGVDLLIAILESAPNVKLVVTSRERLNVREEWTLALRGLSFPEASADLALEHYSAVQLFTTRARQVQPIFSLAANAEAVQRICQHTEGMPLALELAATWLRVMSCAQIAVQMEANLSFLTTPLRNVAARHRSLRAVFEQSWKMLSKAEQDVLMRLIVFRGGFDLNAAEQIAEATLSHLASLADKSLLQVNAGGRYDLHQLLRQYAEEHLTLSEGVDAVRAAHSAYYLNFVAQRDMDIKGSRQQVALHRVRIELDNVQAGLDWALSHQQFGLITTPFLDCLVNFGEMDNHYVDVQMLLKQTEGALAARTSGELQSLWDCVAIRSQRVNFLAGIELDRALVEGVLERARQREDKHEIAYCLWVLGDHSYFALNYPEQIYFHNECLVLRRELGDEFYIAHTLVGPFVSYVVTGQIEYAIQLLQESIRIRRKIGDRNNLCFSLMALAYLNLHLGNLNEIEPLIAEALLIQDEIGKLAAYPALMATKADLAFLRGDFDLAVECIQAGLDLRWRTKLRENKELSAGDLGSRHERAGRLSSSARNP